MEVFGGNPFLIFQVVTGEELRNQQREPGRGGLVQGGPLGLCLYGSFTFRRRTDCAEAGFMLI